jgi:ribose 5-phosphate isomerase B
MAAQACGEYLAGGYEFGVVCCGTGIGISISANKIDGIRCALPQNVFAAEMAKCHNNANFIAFGGRIDYCEPVLDMVDAFVDNSFEAGRHSRRVDKIMALEGGTC